MNNLPLQPLNWARIDTEKLAGIYCQKTHSYIKDAVSFCSTPVADYVIRKDKETGKYSANYGGRNENTYDTIDEAECWAEFTHYRDKMQPYVKPMPTWIDVNKRRPTEKGDYLIRDYQGRVALGKYGNGFYMESGGEKWGMVSHWMPIPEFSNMQNNKGE